MRFLDPDATTIQIGLAYGEPALQYLNLHPDGVDYVEVPFEQLRHRPGVARLQEHIPLVLHCASLSVAGTVPPDPATVQAIAATIERMRSPWLGEHLAFISAHGLGEGQADAIELTYTVSPQFSHESVAQVAQNVAAIRPAIGDVPLILENTPSYVTVPGSTMSSAEYIAAVLRACDVGLLLDLSHFLITCTNTGADPIAELSKIPLDRVVEIHLSGVNVQGGRAWDDHASPVPAAVFDLLRIVLREASPRAVTIEYNWPSEATASVIDEHVRVATEMARAS